MRLVLVSVVLETVDKFLSSTWRSIARIFLPGRSALEVEQRWRNQRDPRLAGRWSDDEDMALMLAVDTLGPNKVSAFVSYYYL